VSASMQSMPPARTWVPRPPSGSHVIRAALKLRRELVWEWCVTDAEEQERDVDAILYVLGLCEQLWPSQPRKLPPPDYGEARCGEGTDPVV